MLEIQDLHVSYGGIHALKGVSLTVPSGSIVALLGSNGAGKSTMVRAISGIVPIRSGTVVFEGRQINHMDAHLVQQQGLVQVPEGRKIFGNLTVRENLLMGAYNNRDKENVLKTMERVFGYFPILRLRIHQFGGTLSGGEQQMLAIGRGLMANPKLLMLDEPSLGLAPLVVAEVFRIIEKIRSEGVTVFLIEQNARAALKISDYAYVLESGRVVLSNSGQHLLDDPRFQEAYLGTTRKRSGKENNVQQ